VHKVQAFGRFVMRVSLVLWCERLGASGANFRVKISSSEERGNQSAWWPQHAAGPLPAL